jgi:hypothetical protein
VFWKAPRRTDAEFNAASRSVRFPMVCVAQYGNVAAHPTNPTHPANHQYVDGDGRDDDDDNDLVPAAAVLDAVFGLT